MEGKIKVLFPDNVEKIIITKDDYDRLYGEMTLENINLKQENEELKEKLNKITEIVKHKPAHTSDYVINYQSAMAQLESIIYVLKGLA